MINEKGDDLRSWLGFAETPKFLKSKPLGALIGVLLVLLIASLFGLAVLAAFKLLGTALFGVGPKGTASSFGLSGVIVAMIGAPLVVWRTTIAQKQTETAEEALFNDKINAAVSDLHAQRQVTKWKEEGQPTGWQDNVTRRNGAIDRLLGLASEEPKAAPRIARILSVYVKELSREYPAKAAPKTNDPKALRAWAQKLKVERSDIQNAVQVLGKLRTQSGQRLDKGEIDLSETNLQGFDLFELDFEDVSFRGAQLQGAVLFSANLQYTVLINANLQGTDLLATKLQGAYLNDAKLQGADLTSTDFRRAKLQNAQFQGTEIFMADFRGANLKNAQFQGAIAKAPKFDVGTTVTHTCFSFAALWQVNCSENLITQEQLTAAFGDASVILPGGKGPDDPEWPDHWSKEKLDWDELKTQWRKFQSDNGFDPNNPK